MRGFFIDLLGIEYILKRAKSLKRPLGDFKDLWIYSCKLRAIDRE